MEGLMTLAERLRYSDGEIRSFLEKQGTPLAHADLQIASIALSMNMTLITGNLKHFQRVPKLTVENWLM
jgi:predicted nucleic acid-binding protein